MIEITLHWYYLPIALFIFPIVMIWINEKLGGYSKANDPFGAGAMLGSFLFTAACWIAAISIVIGHYL